MSKLFAVLVVSVVLIAAGGNVWAQGGGACDRTCLEGFVDRYLDAAIAHDPKLLPLSRSVKFTENGVRLDVRTQQRSATYGASHFHPLAP